MAARINDPLIEAALAARSHAHAPYSRFAVGAAVRVASGRIFAGCNVENAAFPEGQCAEASAIGAMVTAGERAIVEIAVAGTGETLCTPCGGCRQRLAEFAPPETPVHLVVGAGVRETVTLGSLLPLAFSGRDLVQPEATPDDAVAVVRAAIGDLVPRVGLVLGSGLGAVAEAIEPVAAFPFADLPGFPAAGVEGHAGRLVVGRLAGVPIVCLQGRVHLYEGDRPARVSHLVRTLHGLGVAALVLTNAAGSLRPDIGPGSLVLIDDHINLQGTNPLVGPNDARIGPRFVDLGAVYDASLRAILRSAAERLALPLVGGVYLAVLGPAFETPAEIRAYRALGADLVGMSTVPEAISARHCGLRVVGLSIVTNLAAGLAPDHLSHAETLAQAGAAAEHLQHLLLEALPEMAVETSP